MNKKTKIILIIFTLFLTLIIIGGQFLYTSGYYHAIRGGMIEEQNKEKALDYYKQAFSKNPNAYMVAHDIACYYSVNKDKEEALKWLRIVSKTTYAKDAREWARTEKDFQFIKNEPEFKAFLEGTLKD